MAGLALHLRSGTTDDAPQLAALGAAVFRQTYGAAIPAEILEIYLTQHFSAEAFRSDLAGAGSNYLLAWHNAGLAGFGKLEATPPPVGVPARRPVELAKLYVAQAYHGRGVGPALMRETLNEAARLGYYSLWLCVWEKNERALAFYRKWGFSQVGTYEIRVGPISFNDLVLAREIGAQPERKDNLHDR